MRVPFSGFHESIGSTVRERGEVEDRRRVEEHDVLLGDGEVVHHHRRGEVDLDGTRQVDRPRSTT